MSNTQLNFLLTHAWFFGTLVFFATDHWVYGAAALVMALLIGSS